MKGRKKSQESLLQKDQQVQRCCGRGRVDLLMVQQERQGAWIGMDRGRRQEVSS